MKKYLRNLWNDLGPVIVCWNVMFGLIFLWSCASTQPQPLNPSVHPLQSVAQTEATIHKSLLSIHIISLVIASLGAGLFMVGLFMQDKVEENIGMLTAGMGGAVCISTLLGLFALPFVPWIILALGIAGLGFGSYLIYKKFFKKPLPPAQTVV